MTRMANSRVAGSAFLLYIGLGLPGGTLIQKAASGEGVAAQLASVVQHASDVRAAIVLILFSSFCALVLGVTLYTHHARGGLGLGDAGDDLSRRRGGDRWNFRATIALVALAGDRRRRQRA